MASDKANRHKSHEERDFQRPRRKPQNRKKMRGPPREYSPLQEDDWQRLRADLDQAPFIVFDIETTGGNPERNGITEISAIRYCAGKEDGRFYSMVNPCCPIPPIVRKMTGITNRMVKDEPLIEDVMPKFLEFVGRDILVSHNTIGDLKFLVHFAEKACGHSLENFFLCTHLLTEKLIPEAPDKSLKGLAKFFGFPMDQAHRAEADAEMTLALFQELKSRLQGRSRLTIEDGIRLQGDYDSGMRLGWGIDTTSVGEIPSGPGVLFLYGKDRNPLFLSSTTHLEREFRKLAKHSQLPRQLMKIVLQSYRISFEEHPNLFHAMLEECSAINDKPPAYEPHHWHLRSPQTLYIRAEGDRLVLNVGRLEQGIRHAFGLISDRQVVQTMLEGIGRAFDTPVTTKGLTLPIEKEAALISFLSGTIKSELPKMKRSRFALANIINSKNRRAVATACREMQSLCELRVPNGMQRLLSERGIIVGPSMQRDSWLIYPIIDSRPQNPIEVPGDWRAWMRQYPAAQELKERLRKFPLMDAYHELSSWDVARINTTLWFVHLNKGRGTRCHFVSYEQLIAGEF